MSNTISRSLFVAAVSMFGAAGAVHAQAAPTQTAADSVYVRARALVASGNGAAGRVLIDSLVAATDPGSAAYADALYWRATLAANDDDAERDYRRIVVEYALTPHAADALLQLARLESARGDRASAVTHLERFIAENPAHPDRARAAAQLTLMLFDLNDLPRACSTLRQALGIVPDSAVETRNRLTYYTPRCLALDASPGARVPVGEGNTAHRDSVVAQAAPVRFTLQAAAYATKSDADRLATRLRARGIDARVVGSKKPFRVRIGRYVTRGNAVAAQRTLKAKKIATTVTGIEPEAP